MEQVLLSRESRSQDDKQHLGPRSSIRLCSLGRKERFTFMTCQLPELLSYTNKVLCALKG